MTRTEELLRDTLHAYAEDTRVSPDALAQLADRRTPLWRFRRHLGIALATGAALAAVVGVLAVVAAPDGEPSPFVGDPVTPSGPAPESWEAVDVSAVFGADACVEPGEVDCARVADVVWTGQRFVAVGHDGAVPVIARSEDGRDWRAVPLPAPGEPSGERAWIEAVAARGEQLVAVGGVSHGTTETGVPMWTAATWRSDDGGASWEVDLGDPPGRHGAVLFDVEATDTFVAAGVTQGGRPETAPIVATIGGGEGRYHLSQPGVRLSEGPEVQLEAGAGIVAITATAPRCEPGLATTITGKDWDAGSPNGDAGWLPPAAPSAGLENAFAVPCPHLRLFGEDPGSGGLTLTETRSVNARPDLHVRWVDGAPVLHAYVRHEDGTFAQHAFSAEDGRSWRDLGPVVERGNTREIAAVASTMARIYGVAPVDGERDGAGFRVEHQVGDGVGSGLTLLVSDDGGASWHEPSAPTVVRDGQAGSVDRSGFELLGVCEDPADQPAYGATAAAAGTDRLVVVGLATDCLRADAARAAIWLAPLP